MARSRGGGWSRPLRLLRRVLAPCAGRTAGRVALALIWLSLARAAAAAAEGGASFSADGDQNRAPPAMRSVDKPLLAVAALVHRPHCTAASRPRYAISSCASSHSCRAMSPAGAARASAADCPAHADIPWTSPAAAAAARIGAVSPRCTGYGAGGGASRLVQASA